MSQHHANEARADAAAAAYQVYGGEIVDLMSDLAHLADSFGDNGRQMLREALMHYEAEIEPDDIEQDHRSRMEAQP